jgi:hypothetical protein
LILPSAYFSCFDDSLFLTKLHCYKQNIKPLGINTYEFYPFEVGDISLSFWGYFFWNKSGGDRPDYARYNPHHSF